MDYRHTLQHRAATNRHKCSVSGCTAARHGVSLWCAQHKRAVSAHSHPLGVRIYPRDIAPERAEVRRMLRFAEQAQAVASAQAWITAWLRRESGPQYRDAQRLTRHGVTARRILEEICALWLYASRNPRCLPDDIRLDSAMARCVMHLAPREVKRDYGDGVRSYRTTSRKDREAIGHELRDALCVLLETITNPERMKLARGNALNYPLNLVIPNGPH